MKKIIKYTAITLVGFVIVVVLARFITLLSVGFSFNTSLHNAATPIGTSMFWKCFGGLAFLSGLYALRIVFVKYVWKRYPKLKAVITIVFVIGGLALIYWLGYLWYIRSDQEKEYHYEVPEIATKPLENETSDNGVLKGANVFGWEKVSEASFKNLEVLGITSVTLMPFEYQINEDEPYINHIEDLNGLRKKDSTFIKLSKLCKSQQLIVMIKPHLWVERGWRNKIKFETQEDWDLWFSDYRKVMLQYAKVAEAGGADILCIGTGLVESVKQQPNKWKELISEIRKIYSGKLTYAANWYDEYQSVPFWDALDYIGVQSYFPINVEDDVSVATLKKGLKPHIDTLSEISRRYNKKVLFTEMGYRSIVNNHIEPWAWPKEWDIFTKVYSEESQAMAYEALMSSVYGKEWFAGAFLWEFDFNEDDGPQALQRYNFSPRHKKTEEIIKKFYERKYPTIDTLATKNNVEMLPDS